MSPNELDRAAEALLQTVERAIAPVLERLAAVDVRLEGLERQARDHAAAAAVDHDHLVVLQARPAAAAGAAVLDGVGARFAALEARLELLATVPDSLAAARERLAGLEARPIATSPAGADERQDARFAALEASLARLALLPDQLTAARERIAGLEAAPAPPAVDERQEPRFAALEARVALLAAIPDQLTAARERIAGLEARPPVPGPAGADGADGADGAPGRDGRDGVDGLGFDDLGCAFDGDRTLTLTFTRGAASVKSFPVTLPFLRWVGVFRDGVEYRRGDVVTWGGSIFHCEAPTSGKPEAATKAWTLIVKAGRDGRPGKDGAPGPQGPAGKDWQQTYDAMRAR